MALNMEPDGKVIINGPQGITGTPKDATIFYRIYTDSDYVVYRA